MAVRTLVKANSVFFEPVISISSVVTLYSLLVV